MYYKKYIMFLLLFNSYIFGKIVISLGYRCDAALQLRIDNDRHYGLREESYPFDWVISPFEAIYKCIEEDFENYLNPRYLSIYHHASHAWGIQDSYYGFQFIHDFPTTTALIPDEDNPTFHGYIIANFLEHLDPIKEKYMRRIKRFREALSGIEEVIFIRTQFSRDQAIRLHTLIQNNYPSLNFILVAVDSTQEMHWPWNINGIKNFYVNDVWDIGSLYWTNIFKQLELL